MFEKLISHYSFRLSTIGMKQTVISTIVVTLFLSALQAVSLAQSLTVHTVDESTGKPVKGVPVTIRKNFMEPRGAKKGEVQTLNTNSEGKVIFTNIQLEEGGFDVFVFSMGFQGMDQPCFFPAKIAPTIHLSNPIFTSLPSDVTIRVHRRSFGERLKLIYPGP